MDLEPLQNVKIIWTIQDTITDIDLVDDGYDFLYIVKWILAKIIGVGWVLV